MNIVDNQKIIDIITNANDKFIQIEDSEEETFLLYCNLSNYNSADDVKKRQDQKQQELDLELQASKLPQEEKKLFSNGKCSQNDEELSANLTVVQNATTLTKKGVTGTVIWEASVFMSNWLLTYKWWFYGKSCIELGSGTGVVGMTFAKLIESQHKKSASNTSSTKETGFIVCTDQEEILSNLNKNLQANFSKSKLKEDQEIPALISTSEFPWELASKIASRDTKLFPFVNYFPEGPDTIIVSDCIYNEHISPVLVGAVKALSQLRSKHLPPTLTFFSQELRWHSVHQQFLSQLLDQGFECYRFNLEDDSNNAGKFHFSPATQLYVAWLKQE